MENTQSTPSAAPTPTPAAEQPRKSITPTVTACGRSVFVASIAATLVLAYLAFMHLAGGSLAWCVTGGAFNCMSVLDHPMISGFGIVGYAIMIALYVYIAYYGSSVRKAPVLGQRGKYSHQQLFKRIAILGGIVTLDALYITYIQAFVVMAWCIPCLIILICALVILIAALTALMMIADDVKERQVCEFC